MNGEQRWQYALSQSLTQGVVQEFARGTFWFHPECRTKMFHPASGLSISPPRPSIIIDPIREESHA